MSFLWGLSQKMSHASQLSRKISQYFRFHRFFLFCSENGTDGESIVLGPTYSLYLNPLKYYKFHHNFLDTPDPICICLNGIEDVEHFLLNCHDFNDIRNTLMSNVFQKLNVNPTVFTPKKIIEILLYGNKKYKKGVNTYILNQTIAYINKS